MSSNHRHVLIYEPSVEGHHVGWLRFITEDLLGAGFRLTLAVDMEPVAMGRIENHMADLLPQVKIIPAFPEQVAHSKNISTAQVATCLKQSGADRVFLAHFNDLSSSVLRRAAFGLMPEKCLRGKLGGIYLRPQFLTASAVSPNEMVKKIGFHRLVKNGWLNPLLFLDPYLCDVAQKKYPGAPISFLPDPYPEDFYADRTASRKYFNLPDDKFVFLFYGGGYKRKGLHLAVAAMRQMSASGNAFLLCAGLQPKNEDIARDLAMLHSQGIAESANRYVSAGEEKQLFAACDAVLLPYINHQGTSGVLSCAAGAGKPVIASDEHFIGQTVRKYGMGPLFKSGDVVELKNAMIRTASASPEELLQWQAGAKAFGKTCSRSAFRSALVASVESAFAARK